MILLWHSRCDALLTLYLSGPWSFGTVLYPVPVGLLDPGALYLGRTGPSAQGPRASALVLNLLSLGTVPCTCLTGQVLYGGVRCQKTRGDKYRAQARRADSPCPSAKDEGYRIVPRCISLPKPQTMSALCSVQSTLSPRHHVPKPLILPWRFTLTNIRIPIALA
jgi:hypothetical protein